MIRFPYVVLGDVKGTRCALPLLHAYSYTQKWKKNEVNLLCDIFEGWKNSG